MRRSKRWRVIPWDVFRLFLIFHEFFSYLVSLELNSMKTERIIKHFTNHLSHFQLLLNLINIFNHFPILQSNAPIILCLFCLIFDWKQSSYIQCLIIVLFSLLQKTEHYNVVTAVDCEVCRVILGFNRIWRFQWNYYVDLIYLFEALLQLILTCLSPLFQQVFLEQH